MPSTQIRAATGCAYRFMLARAAMVMLVVAVPASGEPGPHLAGRDAIWLQPPERLLGAIGPALLRVPPSVDTLIVDVFNGGRVVGGECSLFPTNPWVPPTADQLAGLIAACHRRGMRVYASVDLLRWEAPAADQGSRLFVRHPLLKEFPLVTGSEPQSDGAYASPWHPQVRRAVADLMQGIATRYPALDGVCLTCRMSSRSMLGYSNAARQAYIREKGVDPVDVVFETEQSEMQQMAREWSLWRRAGLTGILASAAAAFRDGIRQARKKAAMPPGSQVRIVAEAYAPFYALREESQARMAEDWLRWATEGVVDELIATPGAQVGWSDPAARNALSGVYALLEKLKRAVDMRPRVMVRHAATAEALRRERDLLAQGTPKRGVVLVVGEIAELDRALGILGLPPGNGGDQ